MSNLPALQRENEITRRLEADYRERGYQLTEQERTLRLRNRYRYSLLPRLPTEVIMQILSLLGPLSRNNVNTGIRDAILVEARGLLPYLILKPYLMHPPYSKYFDATMTVDKFFFHEVEMPILMEADVLNSVKLEVAIYDWEKLRRNDNFIILHSLLQMPHQWKKLRLKVRDARQLLPLLDVLSPCLPHIEYLNAFDGPPNPISANTVSITSSKPMTAISRSLRGATLSFPILSTLFDIGFLNSITYLGLLDPIPVEGENYARSVHILSSLPCLKTLSIESLNRLRDEHSLSHRVKSSSLNGLSLNLRKSTHAHSLELFTDCHIDTIHVGVRSVNILGALVRFPGLKELKCNAKDELHLLSSAGPDGKLAFPQLENLTIKWNLEMNIILSHGVFELILRALRIRSSTPGVKSVKCLSLFTNDNCRRTLGAWEERFSHYVDRLHIFS